MKLTRGQRVIKFIERYCLVPEGDKTGQPIKLAPFQEKFILSIYDNKHITRKAILSIARKNGKTALIACLLLAHITGPEAVTNSQIVSGAMSRDQAGLVFALASKMINLNKDLADLCRIIPSKKTIIGLSCNVEYKALAADSSTAHGLSPVLAILDEIGQIRGPQDDFVDAITTSQGAYSNPLLIVISTQAPTDGDLLSMWIDDARTGADKQTICHLYATSEGTAITDKRGWKSSNPAIGIFRDKKDVEIKAKEAERLPSSENTFRNLILNQRVDTVAPFISRNVWEKCGDIPGNLRKDICLALDLSSVTDLSAMIAISLDSPKLDVHSYFWTPEHGLRERSKRDRVPYDIWHKQGKLLTSPGKSIDYSFIAQQVAELSKDHNIRVLAFDPWRINDFFRELKNIGIKVAEPIGMDKFKEMTTSKKTNNVNTFTGEIVMVRHMQGYKDMTPSLGMLEKELLNANIRHGMHPVLTMCAANAVAVEDGSENKRLMKNKSTGRIDGIVALAMAVGVTMPMKKIEAKLGNDGSLINIAI